MKELKCVSCHGVLEVKQQNSLIVKCGFCGTENQLDIGAIKIVVDNSHKYSSLLARAMRETFNLAELKDITIQMNRNLPAGYVCDPDGFPSTKPSYVLELVMWSQRRGVLQILLNTALEFRPTLYLYFDL
jgi:hypothetical protein